MSWNYWSDFHQTYTNDVLWDRDDCAKVCGQKVKVQRLGGITYAGTVTAQPEAYSSRCLTMENVCYICVCVCACVRACFCVCVLVRMIKVTYLLHRVLRIWLMLETSLAAECQRLKQQQQQQPMMSVLNNGQYHQVCFLFAVGFDAEKFI